MPDSEIDAHIVERITDGIALSAVTAISDALRNRVAPVVWRDGKVVEIPLHEVDRLQQKITPVGHS